MSERRRLPGLWCAVLAAALVLSLAGRALAEAIPGRIALVGLDHQVYVADPNGGEPRPLTKGESGRVASSPGGALPVSAAADEPATSQRFSYPAWSPDGSILLAMGSRIGPADMVKQAGVYRLSLDRPGVVTPVFEDEKRSPIYVFWDPTGKRTAVLVSDGSGISLGVVEVEKGELRTVMQGFPFYFDWGADGRTLATHTGGAAEEGHPAEVSLVDLGSAEKPKVERLTDRPVAFRAPAWSPDGKKLAYAAATANPRRTMIVVRSRSGGETEEIGPVSGRLVFSWIPDGSGFAVAEAASPDSPLFAGVNLVGFDGTRDPLFAGPVGMFFWSPDGKKLLVASPDFGSGEWRWFVIERATRKTRQVARFLPSPDLQMLLLHFDQYGLSHRLWAPDSRHFVFSSYPAEARDEGRPVPSVVWIVDTDTARMKRVAEGRSAFWSPR